VPLIFPASFTKQGIGLSKIENGNTKTGDDHYHRKSIKSHLQFLSNFDTAILAQKEFIGQPWKYTQKITLRRAGLSGKWALT
jgi:hypothetical protein